LTQAELAESSGISERTVSDLERGLRATAFPSTARRLATALSVSQDELAAFLSEARGHTGADTLIPATAPMPSDQRARLPVPLTRLLGRESELSMVLGLVLGTEARLVTLVGPGGIGKTRLAIEVATQAQTEFPGGTFFVSLSATDDPEMVLPSIATAVGLPQAAYDLHLRLARLLSTGRALLMLDTFEHLVAAAPAIGELLESNPQLTVLATSRIPLHLRGEREVPVLPLPVRPEDDRSASAPAVELFLERAVAVMPGFDAVPAELEVVADICARVDGLPLAIELAAARVKHMPPSELRRQLDHRLEPLVGGARDLPARQRTMRGTHDWSYALLGAAEMRLFRCLAAFRGGFGREAAEAISRSAEPSGVADVLTTLSALVDSSLVLVESSSSSQARYRLLDVTRDYAVERSVAAGEFDGLRRRHADFFLAVAERAEPELRGSAQREWHVRLLEDEGNFRAALTWALEVGESEVALRLAGALWMFWRWAGLFAEGRAWLEAALASGEDCPLEVRCQGLWGSGWLAYHQGDYRRTGEAGGQMLQVLTAGDGDLLRRNALTLVGNAALAEERNNDAIAALGDALALCERLGKNWHLATSLLNLGTALLHSGQASEGRDLFNRAVTIYEELGDQHFVAWTLIQIGYAELAMGKPATAAVEVTRAMEMVAELGDAWGIAAGLEAVATLRSEDEPRSAALLAGAAERIRERISTLAHPSDASINRAYLELARGRLTGQAFEDAWRKGRGMTLEAAIGLARSGPVNTQNPTPQESY